MASYYDDGGDGQYGGGRGAGGMSRRRPRPVTDYGSSLVQYMQTRRPRYKGSHRMEAERPSASYIVDMVPPAARINSPADSIPVRHLHTSLGKSKKPVTVVRWMPEGRRLLAGVHNGEFMLWNGMAFNFETVMTASVNHSIRAAEWSNGKDWLLSADDEGTVKYWQTNFNNVNEFRAHDMPVRDLSFSPTDVKFVTASDDSTLKIFDFSTSNCEATLEGHSWDAKSCDWHPSKGLIVSGSKDHSVKLWDPRSSRNLTTLHSHKNALTATVFSRLRDQLLATAGRDNLARVFDLRMMRDVCILRGHEKGITALTWHPIHASMISTGSDDGALHTYLLDEPNPPSGSAPSISPYNTPDPTTGPAQSIFPAHRITYAHESSIWSLDWHPLGHILATGSNDHFTRFWSRARPGETTCFKDQFHLGEEGAEAQGTYSRNYGQRKLREQEEQELEDEAEGLVDQKMPVARPPFGIPGLPLTHPSDGTSTGGAQSIIPGMGNAPPLPPPHNLNLPGLPGLNGGPAMDPSRLANLFKSGALPPPGGLPPPPLPGGLPADFDLSKLVLPPGFQIPAGFPPPPPPPQHQQQQQMNGGGGGIPGLGGGGGGGNGIPGGGAGAGRPQENGGAASIRRRAPLPSQQESLMAEQRRGNFRKAN